MIQRLCLVSCALHLAALLSIRLQMASAAIAPAPPASTVVFLGAILDSPLISNISNRPVEVAPSPAAPALPQVSVPAPPRELPMTIRDLPPTDVVLMLPTPVFAAEKQLPHSVTTVVASAGVPAAPVWIRGPARQRELLHRPALAPYLARMPLTRLRSRELAEKVEVQLRFTIAADGHVDRVAVVQSSGDPLLDLVGLQYLKDWRFAAADPRDIRHPASSWGQITLRLEFEPR